MPAMRMRHRPSATAPSARPTVAWLDSAFRFMKRFTDPRYAPKIRLPTLVIAAGADPVCATPATERFAARLKAGHAIVIPGARHEILMESGRRSANSSGPPSMPSSPERPTGLSGRTRTPAVLTAQELDGGGMDPAIAGRDDTPALSG